MQHRMACRLGRVFLIAWLPAVALPAGAAQQTFDSPEKAVAALAALIGTRDEAAIERVFGADSVPYFASGDPDADTADYVRVKAMIGEKVAFVDHDEHTRVALFGENAWPWPIPLVAEGGRWRFDMEAGREELLNRRIGRNELYALAALREIVEAQREYASTGRDGLPPAFASRFLSSEGRQDGLYWPAAEGEAESPLGELLAESDTRNVSEPRPFHGYFFRILTAQGRYAPGGAKSYLDAEGRMTGGFAVLAWPAKHGNSGVMSFLLSQRGIIYQRDLGTGTAEAAAAIATFDPDPGWMPTGDAGLMEIE